MGLTERLARGCAAHPRLTLALWGVAVARRARARGDLAARADLELARDRQSRVDEGRGRDRPGVPATRARNGKGDVVVVAPAATRSTRRSSRRSRSGSKPTSARPGRWTRSTRSASLARRPCGACLRRDQERLRRGAGRAGAWRTRTAAPSRSASPATTRRTTTSASSRRRISRPASSRSACPRR